MAVSQSSGSQLALAGAFGGVAEALAVQPFDMVKTRHQLLTSSTPSVMSTMRAIMKEGGFFRFYRGVLPEAAGMMPKSSAMYATNELCKRELSRHFGSRDGQPTWPIAFVAGALSGYPEAITVTPFQVVKVRMQAKEHLGRYTSSADCFIKVLRQEGPLALATGMGPTCWRNCVWNGIYFGLMHNVRAALPTPASRAMDLLQSLIVGCSAGIIATCFNCPFDVAKSRFQSQLPPYLNNGLPLKYRFTLASLATIYSEEGARALYKGFAAKAIRMGVGGGVCMAAFELACVAMGASATDADEE